MHLRADRGGIQVRMAQNAWLVDGMPPRPSHPASVIAIMSPFRDMKTALKAFAAVAALFILTACSPEVGSEAWCVDMEEKPKGDWTTNEAGDFAKHCIFR